MKVHHAIGLLLLTAMPSCTAPGTGRDGALATRRATLGIRTSVPEAGLAEKLGLTLNARREGRYVDHVAAGGPAALAGVRQGDVLLSVDEITLFSGDDLADFLGVSEPGQRVVLKLKRAGEPNARSLSATLGSEPSPIADEPTFDWQYASLAQLPRALEAARVENKRVLVGLSGAET